MKEDIDEVAALVHRLKGTGVHRVKMGDVEVEFEPGNGSQAPTTREPLKQEPLTLPPDLEEPTEEQLALWSSSCCPRPNE